MNSSILFARRLRQFFLGYAFYSGCPLRRESTRNEPGDCKTLLGLNSRARAPSQQNLFITDAEILALPGVGLLTLDELDRHPDTQKPEGKDARPRAAVEARLKARGVSLDLDKP